MGSILLDSWLAGRDLQIIPEFVDKCLRNSAYLMD